MKKLLIIFCFLIAVTGFASLISLPPTAATTASSTSDQEAWSFYLMQQNSTRAFAFLTQAVTANFNLVFNNALGLTPAQMSTAMGTNACQAHMMFLAASQMINTVSPGSFTLTEPCTVTCNQDGTTNVTACPSPSPSP